MSREIKFVDCDIFCVDDFVYDGDINITGNFYAEKAVKVNHIYALESVCITAYFDTVSVYELLSSGDIYIECQKFIAETISSLGSSYIDTTPILDGPCDFCELNSICDCKCCGHCDYDECEAFDHCKYEDSIPCYCLAGDECNVEQCPCNLRDTDICHHCNRCMS